MNDISNKNTKIMYPKFREMSGYHFLFQKYYNHTAQNIPIDSKNSITQDRYQEMLHRVTTYTRSHNNTPPLYVTINPTNPCYRSPRFLTGQDIKQSTNYFCACKISQQILYELYGIYVPETELAQLSHTTQEYGTSHTGIQDAITKETTKHGHQVKIQFEYLKNITWKQIGEMIANPNIGIFIHSLYKNRWGHYEYIIGICTHNNTIIVANSLTGEIEHRPIKTMKEYIKGISQPSIGIVTKIR
jgi:hypothetical protein